MKKFTLLFLFILSAGLCGGQPWTKVQLSERVSVDFPKPPEVHEIGNKKVYQSAEPEYVIAVLIADMNSMSNFAVDSIGLDNFYKGIVRGRMAAAADSKLLDENDIKLGGCKGLEIRYTKDFNGQEDIVVTSEIVLVDKLLFQFDIWDISKKGQEKLMNTFFKSIQFK